MTLYRSPLPYAVSYTWLSLASNTLFLSPKNSLPRLLLVLVQCLHGLNDLVDNFFPSYRLSGHLPVQWKGQPGANRRKILLFFRQILVHAKDRRVREACSHCSSTEPEVFLMMIITVCGEMIPQQESWESVLPIQSLHRWEIQWDKIWLEFLLWICEFLFAWFVMFYLFVYWLVKLCFLNVNVPTKNSGNDGQV